MTVSAVARLMPSPPARVERRKTKSLIVEEGGRERGERERGERGREGKEGRGRDEI